MKNFKVGDEVVRIEEDACSWFKVGDVATVIFVANENNIHCTNEEIQRQSNSKKWVCDPMYIKKLTKLDKALK